MNKEMIESSYTDQTVQAYRLALPELIQVFGADLSLSHAIVGQSGTVYDFVPPEELAEVLDYCQSGYHATEPMFLISRAQVVQE